MTHDQHKKIHPKREKVSLEALRQGMAIIKRGLEVHGMHQDGSSELISRSKAKEYIWEDALSALEARSVPKGVAEKPKEIPDGAKALKIYCDGASRGNPGHSASGYVIMTEDEKILESGGEYLGITTNNQAEYHAVKLALEAAKKYDPKNLNFFLDSLLVVNQLNGVFKVKSPDLWPVYSAIIELVKEYNKVKFSHIYREFNTLADGEANKILDNRK